MVRPTPRLYVLVPGVNEETTAFHEDIGKGVLPYLSSSRLSHINCSESNKEVS